MKLRSLAVLVAFSIAVFTVLGQQALAQDGHSDVRIQITPPSHPLELRTPNPGADGVMVPLISGFSVLPPTDGGFDAWPCQPTTGDNSADCSSISPGGLVIGTPAYTWSYAACDADSSMSTNCGQVFWSYEDDTGDNTDDVLVSVSAKQGTAVLLDTGKINLGVNTAAAGSTVLISLDTAFGTLGATGKNNGYCAGSGKTCANPLSSAPITIMMNTTIGRYKLMKSFKIILE
jgi:hypothetical protein